MSEHMHDGSFFKRGFLYFGFIQLMVLLSLLLSLPCQFVIALALPSVQGVLREGVNGLVSVLLECLAVFFFFRTYHRNNKRTDRRAFLLPCALALPLHLALSLLTGCYPYIAGWGVSALGSVWGSQLVGRWLDDHRDIPYYVFIPLMLVMTALLLLSVYLGYLSAEKRIKREHDAIVGNRDNT